MGTRAESVHGVLLLLPWIIIEAVDPHGTTRHFRSDVNAVAAAPGRPRCAPIDDPGPLTRTEIETETETEIAIAIEIGRENTPEGIDRDRDRAVGPAHGTGDEAAVVIVAEIDIGTEIVVNTIPEHPRMNRMCWMIMERGRG